MFERFSRNNRRSASYITLNKAGLLAFSSGAKAEYNIADYTYCVLYYDKQTQRVGIELTSDGKQDGAIRLRQRKTGADISARAFCQHYHIDHAVSRKHNVSLDGKMLTFRLKDGRDGKTGRLHPAQAAV